MIDLWQDLQRKKFLKRKLPGSSHFSSECVVVPVEAPRHHQLSSSCSHQHSVLAKNVLKTASDQDFDISSVYVYNKKSCKRQQMKLDKQSCRQDKMMLDSNSGKTSNYNYKNGSSFTTEKDDYLSALAFLTNIHTPTTEQNGIPTEAKLPMTPIMTREKRNFELKNDEGIVNDEFSSLLEVYCCFERK